MLLVIFHLKLLLNIQFLNFLLPQLLSSEQILCNQSARSDDFTWPCFQLLLHPLLPLSWSQNLLNPLAIVYPIFIFIFGKLLHGWNCQKAGGYIHSPLASQVFLRIYGCFQTEMRLKMDGSNALSKPV